MKAKHIRREYNQWIEWDYKKVSTLCGPKSLAGSTGIPGISPANTEWCGRCARILSLAIESLEATGQELDPRIKELYSQAWLAVYPAKVQLANAEEKRREEYKKLVQKRESLRLAREIV